MKTPLVFIAIFFIFLSGAFSVFSQDQSDNYRRFTGYVKDSDNQPLSGATVCGWDKSDRPIHGRIPCVRSQADGSFELRIIKWEGDTYHLWAYDSEKGYPDPFISSLYEGFLFDNRNIDVYGSNASKPVELRFGEVKAGKMTLKMIDDESGQPVDKGAVVICSVDNPQHCQSLSTNFPNGVYEFLTPQSAFTLAVQWFDGNDWKDWEVLDKNRRKIESLKVELGQSKTINIRLRK